ncbi:hypothetical protein IZU99_05430 [Oscillospiraceae bacterium CM]|nr:hypothetical protein IZU99_05430 [Oscillospiraceae bacterium CM]
MIVLIIVSIFILLTVGGSVALVVYGGSAPVYSISSTDRTFTIKSMYGKTLNLADIKSVDLKETLPGNLKRTNGYGGAGTVTKGYCSSDIGDVLVFVDSSISQYIYLTTTTEIIIFNNHDIVQTKALYDELVAAIAQ